MSLDVLRIVCKCACVNGVSDAVMWLLATGFPFFSHAEAQKKVWSDFNHAHGRSPVNGGSSSDWPALVRGHALTKGERYRGICSHITRICCDTQLWPPLVTEGQFNVARRYYCSTEIYRTGQGLATFSLLSINSSYCLYICYALIIGVSGCLILSCPDYSTSHQTTTQEFRLHQSCPRSLDCPLPRALSPIS